MSEPDPIKKTSIAVRESLHWRFKQTAALRRMSEKTAMEEALENWVTGTTTQGLDHVTHLDTLARILRSDDDRARDMILPLLANWAKSHANTEETAQESTDDRPKIARAR